MRSQRAVTYKGIKEEVFDMKSNLEQFLKVSEENYSNEFQNNSVYYILKGLELFWQNYQNNSCFNRSNSRELFWDSPEYFDACLKAVGRILSSDKFRKVVEYFLLHKAATLPILYDRLKLKRKTLYWILEELEVYGVIQTITEIDENRRGRKFKVYATPDATEEDINKAIRLHKRLRSPKYRIAEKLAQTLLTDYITKAQSNEITFREIVITIREIKIPYNKYDIAEIVAKILEEKGIKVWR